LPAADPDRGLYAHNAQYAHRRALALRVQFKARFVILIAIWLALVLVLVLVLCDIANCNIQSAILVG
jgi:hypothetical protein